ncbi:MAG TPA: polysaccharide pyruvyl transferase family protein [Clostridia bacterium]
MNVAKFIAKVKNAKNKKQKIFRLVFKPFMNMVYYDSILKYKDRKKILFLVSNECSNLGDIAIDCAIEQWIKNKFPDHLLVEFSDHETLLYTKAIKRITNKDDIIIIPGGGNFGDLYPFTESIRRKVVKTFKDNTIIQMPQSVSFSNTKQGQHQIEISKKIYSKHQKLAIICRDEGSFNFAKSTYKSNSVHLCPDIVHYLDIEYEKAYARKGVLLVLRNDNERNLDDDAHKTLIDLLKKKKLDYRNQDTDINKKVLKEEKIYEIKKILKEFAKSQLVITDRFHGLVFSVITGTPCIVFKSHDHKIAEGIKWHSKLNYIFYLGKDYDKLESNIDSALEVEPKMADFRTDINKKLDEVYSMLSRM